MIKILLKVLIKLMLSIDFLFDDQIFCERQHLFFDDSVKSVGKLSTSYNLVLLN